MADVFISYKSEERAFAETLAHGLGQEGFTVWQDQQQLRGDSEYYSQIARAVADAKVVCAIWSALANDSRWLHSEADIADKAGKLINVSLDGSRPPNPFNRLQCRGLSGWQGDAADDRFRLLVEDLRRVIARGDGNPVADRWLQPDSRAARAWALIQDETEPERYRQFRAVHGASPQDALAKEHLTDIAKWRALPAAPSREKLAAIDQFIQSGPFKVLGESAKKLRRETLGVVEMLEERAARNANADFDRAKAEFVGAQRRIWEQLPVAEAAKRNKEDVERRERELKLARLELDAVGRSEPVEVEFADLTDSDANGCFVAWLLFLGVLGIGVFSLYREVDRGNWGAVWVFFGTVCAMSFVFSRTKISINPAAFKRGSIKQKGHVAERERAKAKAAHQTAEAAADQAWKPFKKMIDEFESKRPRR